MEKYPLLQAQLGVFLENIPYPESTQYNIPGLFKLPSDLDPDRFEEAWQVLFEKKAVFKLRFGQDADGNPYQWHDEAMKISISRCSCAEEDLSDMVKKAIRPFDFLSGEPLIRLTLFRTPINYYLFMDCHHLILDASSFSILLKQELQKAYTGQIVTKDWGILEEAASEEALFHSEKYENAKNYLHDKFASIDFITFSNKDYCPADVISADRFVPQQACDDFCQEMGISLNDLFQGAFSYVSGMLSRQNHPAYGMGYHNRFNDIRKNSLGMFVSVLPFQTELSKDISLKDYFAQIHRDLKDALSNSAYPISHFYRDNNKIPRVNFNFTVSKTTNVSIELGNYSSVMDKLPRPVIHSDLSLYILPSDNSYRIFADSSSAVNDPELPDIFVEAMKSCILNMIANPKAKLGEISLPSKEREMDLLSISYGGELSYDTSKTWVDLFKIQVRDHGDLEAVADRWGSLTYSQLDRQSDMVAHYLLSHGVKSDDFVAIKMGRFKEFITAVMGINKAGAAYVPIDPEYPEDRIAYMIEDSGAKITLTRENVDEILCHGMDMEITDEFTSLTRAQNYAYMIYTSGSTGRPKGAIIKQSSISACAAWLIKAFDLKPGKRNLHHPSFSFDASTFDLFYPLSAGAAIHILDEETRKDTEAIATYIKDYGITGMTASTAIGMMLLNQCDLDMEYIMLGGEKFLPVRETSTKLFNGYGPTEFTVCSSYHIIDQQKDVDIPIGRAVPNTYSFICDSFGHLLPRGMTGELCLAGPQLSCGYQNLPQKTDEVFVDCPYLPGRKMYRTGDLARYNENNELEYLGRIDFQVKLNGYRIELEEIENRSAAYPGMGQVCAQVKNEKLVLYFTADNQIDTASLKAFLEETLTSYMVPSAYMQLEFMPMTPGGKIDRKALPEPQLAGSAQYVAPANIAEEIIAKTMQQILGLKNDVGALDNFFELGGDSIKAIRMVSLLRQQGLTLKTSDIMRLKTVRDMAGAAKVSGPGADSLSAGNTGSEASSSDFYSNSSQQISQAPFEGPVSDTAIIKFFKYLSLPKESHFNQAMLFELRDRANLPVLQETLNAIVSQHDMLRAVVRDGQLYVRGLDTRIQIQEYDIDVMSNTVPGITACESHQNEPVDHDCKDSFTTTNDNRNRITSICSRLQSSIDLSENLVKAALIHDKDTDYFFMVIHHLAVDGVSWRIITDDLEEAYSQLLKGEAVHLPEKTSCYNDYSEALKSYRNSRDLEIEIPYWENIQSKLTRITHSNEHDRKRSLKSLNVILNQEQTEKFSHSKFSIFNGDINDALLTALCESYSKAFNENAVSIQLEGHGRENINSDSPVLDRTVGWFTSIYPIVVENICNDLNKDLPNVKEVLHRVPNKGVGFNVLRFIEGRQKVDFATGVIPRIAFNYMGEMGNANLDDTNDNSTVSLPFFKMNEDISKCGEYSAFENIFGPDLSINCGITNGCFWLNLLYNSDMYAEPKACEFVNGIIKELDSLSSFLSDQKDQILTASDLGENEWNNEEFNDILDEFSTRGEKIERIYPLTSMQEGMLLNHISHPESWAYRLVIIYEINALPSEESLTRALYRLGQKHEVLRSAIIYEGVSSPRQAVIDRRLGLEMLDFSSKSDPEAEVLSYRKVILSRDFDLQRKPLFKLSCIKKGNNSSYLVIAVHHILVDGWCIELYLSDLFNYIREEISIRKDLNTTSKSSHVLDSGSASHLAAYTTSDLDSHPAAWSFGGPVDISRSTKGLYEAAVRNILKKDTKEGLAYWARLLEDYDTRAAIPYGNPKDDSDMPLPNSSDEYTCYLSSDIAGRLNAICRQEHATFSNCLELAWGLVLQAYSNTKDVVFAKVVSGRDNADMDVNDVVGLFINTVPVRVKTDASVTIRQMLGSLQQQAAESSAYDFCALTDIQQQSQLGNRLFQTVIAFENYSSGSNDAFSKNNLSSNDALNAKNSFSSDNDGYFISAGESGLNIRPILLREEPFGEINISMELMPDGRLYLHISFNNKLYSLKDAEGIGKLFCTLAEGMAENPDRAVSELPRVGKEDIADLMALSKGEELPYDPQKTWVDMFKDQVKDHGDMEAISDSAGSLTYKELDLQSDMVARYLISKGVKPDDFVPIKMGRFKEFIVAVLGINKAGAAYIPVDPEYPKDRIDYMIENSGAKIVLTKEDVDWILVHNRDGKIFNINEEFAILTRPENYAYMIYTSGSTGRPKGAIIKQNSISACAAWLIRDFDLKPGKRNLSFASFSFDASTFDLFYPLAAGASIHVLDETTQKDIHGTAAFINDHHITGMTGSTAMGMMLLNQCDLNMEYIMLGGEKFMPVKKTSTKLFNGYGPTECTCVTVYHILDQEKDKDIPIGRPVPNSYIFICDSFGNLLPQGLTGELCIAGPQVGCGYWNLPEKTAEVFVDCPLLPGQKMYRTGDLARYNEDNVLECLGRIDFQVKLRGFRIELGEIENRSAAYPGMGQVCAQVKKDQLVLYYTAKTPIDNDELKDFMAQALTEYMVPTIFMQLDTMPITAGGKIDRKALPEPQIDLGEIISPETETEKLIFRLVANQLNRDDFGVTTNLLSLGMSSITAMKLASDIDSHTSCTIKFADIMKQSTVRDLAALIDSGAQDDRTIKHVKNRPYYPITENQRGIYVDWEGHHDTVQYNIPAAYKFTNKDPQRLALAVQSAIDAHSTLKTRFALLDNDIRQVPHNEEMAKASVIVLKEEPNSAFFQALVKPFDLFNDRLYRAEIYIYGEYTYLFLDIHHIIYDGLSALILLKDIMTIYEGGQAKTEKINAYDYSVYENELTDSQAYQDAEKYFDDMLADASPVVLKDSEGNGQKAPTAKTQNEVVSDSEACDKEACSEDAWDENSTGEALGRVEISISGSEINEACSKMGITVSSFLQAAFAETLQRLSREKKPMYLTISSGRETDTMLSDCVGMFVKTLPVVLSSDDFKFKSVSEYAKAFHKQLQSTIENDFYPYTKIVEKQGLRGQVMFIYQGGVEDTLLKANSAASESPLAKGHEVSDAVISEGAMADGHEVQDAQVENIPLTLDTAKLPVVVSVHPKDDHYIVNVDYDQNRYTQSDMTKLAMSFSNMALAMTRREYISQCSVISEDEKALLLELSAGEKLEYNAGETWIDMFKRHAQNQPDAIAVTDSLGSFTYGELDSLSDLLAHYLISEGVKPNDFVAIKMDRVKEFTLAVIGINKAGAAFVPIDPTYPADRIDYMLKDSKAKLVITEELLADIPHDPSGDKPHIFETISQEDENRTNNTQTGESEVFANTAQTGECVVCITPENYAYMIYTSGSTGQPKGVVQSHRSLRAYLAWRLPALGINENSCHGHHASFSFDASMDDLICPLSAGGQCHIFCEDIRKDLEAMHRYIIDHKINGLTMSTQIGMLMINQYPDMPLDFIMMGGEKMLPCRKTNIKIINGYGPTEFTVCSSFHVVEQARDQDIPIGRPVPNTYSFVCDPKGQLMPRGEAGELCLIGPQLSSGYWNLPEKTAEVFVDCPFLHGQKMYRTGDLVRYNCDGQLEYLGRIDFQVKLRGYRVELGEVENRAKAYEDISQVSAQVNGDRLLLYYTSDREIDRENLRMFMGQTLAEYMVPDVFIKLDQMPLTPGGKIDRNALLSMEIQEKTRSKRLPQTPMEEKIVAFMADTLGRTDIYVTDNFFEMGGTSLSAAKFIMLLKTEGIPLVYQDIFDHQTPLELAAYLDGVQKAASMQNTSAQTAALQTSSTENSEDADSASVYGDSYGTDEILKYNSLSYADQLVRQPLGNVLLTGSTGFLGAHVLKELLDSDTDQIILLIRSQAQTNSLTRLQSVLVYYFENDFAEAFKDRIKIIDGDLTADNLSQLLVDMKIDTIINCAACVKHYAKDNSIEHINVDGVRNLIGIALEKNARLVQISTISVPGAHNSQTSQINMKMKENQLFVIDDMNNQYIRSKYKAERMILTAIATEGLRGRIIRVGNLMGRYSDGEFQINIHTNSFLNSLKGFVSLGKSPLSHSTDSMGFSPIDCTARAVVLLASVNDMFTAFNADNRYGLDQMKLIESMNRCGIPVKPVPDEEYAEDFNRMMADPNQDRELSAALANGRPNLHMIETDNRFTANILYRLGFSWPFISDEYLDNVIDSVNSLGFFL